MGGSPVWLHYQSSTRRVVVSQSPGCLLVIRIIPQAQSYLLPSWGLPPTCCVVVARFKLHYLYFAGVAMLFLDWIDWINPETLALPRRSPQLSLAISLFVNQRWLGYVTGRLVAICIITLRFFVSRWLTTCFVGHRFAWHIRVHVIDTSLLLQNL